MAKNAKKTTALSMNHVEAVVVDDSFEALLADLGMPADLATKPVSDEVLESSVASIEAAEVVMSTATPDAIIDGHETTAADKIASAEELTEAVAAEEGEATVKVKKERAPRKHYADKIERLKDRIGADLPEYSVLTLQDASSIVGDEELKAITERTMDIIRGMNSKEKNRATNFMEYLSGKRAKLNAVLERVLRVLARDGYLQTGNEGNVHKDLLSAEYSAASARAMGGNTLGMFADLKVILPLEGHKGRFVANEDSLLLAKAQAMLNAEPAPAAAEPAAEEPLKEAA